MISTQPARPAINSAANGIALLWMFLGLAVSGCIPRPANETESPAGIDYYVQGAQAYRAGQRDEAIIQLERAVNANPNLRMAQTMLGDAYRAKGDYQRAAVHYQTATQLDPYTLSNRYNLGVAYQFLNRLEDAAAAYLGALQLNPRDVKSNMNLGLVYLAVGRLDDAVTYLERAARLDPGNASAWSNLGVALDARGSAVLAESTYRKALELDSNNVVTLQNLAQNLIGQGKADQAVSIMELVLARTDSPPAHKRYGDALALARKYDQAIAQYDLAIKADPRFLPAINEKGFTLIQKYQASLQLDDNQRLEALKLWTTSLKINPSQPRISQALQKWQNPGLF